MIQKIVATCDVLVFLGCVGFFWDAMIWLVGHCTRHPVSGVTRLIKCIANIKYMIRCAWKRIQMIIMRHCPKQLTAVVVNYTDTFGDSALDRLCSGRSDRHSHRLTSFIQSRLTLLSKCSNWRLSKNRGLVADIVASKKVALSRLG